MKARVFTEEYIDGIFYKYWCFCFVLGVCDISLVLVSTVKGVLFHFSPRKDM